MAVSRTRRGLLTVAGARRAVAGSLLAVSRTRLTVARLLLLLTVVHG